MALSDLPTSGAAKVEIQNEGNVREAQNPSAKSAIKRSASSSFEPGLRTTSKDFEKVYGFVKMHNVVKFSLTFSFSIIKRILLLGSTACLP